MTNVTAMPLGLDTPSTIGMVLLVLGPSLQAGRRSGMDEQTAAMQTWHIGICAIFISGIVKGRFVVLLQLDSPRVSSRRIVGFAGGDRIGVDRVHADA